MSIYIKGMEMPITCCHCPLMGYDPDREWSDSMARTGAHICVLTGALIDNTKREENCPLVPVPEHGDLIDRQAFRYEMDKHYPFDKATQSEHGIEDVLKSAVLQMLFDAPTIIPAEEGE